jgi:hypothetical protein
MAKNFTDFQSVTGQFTGSGNDHTTGTTVTQATTGMHLAGYDTGQPEGERDYTIESVLLAADKYHVGLENVDNEAKTYMFDNSFFTGSMSAYDLIVRNNLAVLGSTTTLNTETMATSSIDIHNSGSTIALKVVQTGSEGIARFLDAGNIALDVADGGWVGVKTEGQNGTALTIAGNISASGEIFVGHEVDGRHVKEDGDKLDDIENNSDVTGHALSSVSTRLAELGYGDASNLLAMDLIEDGTTYKKYTPAERTKLSGIEALADVTGDHSADITYNLIPNGPYSGDKTTTYVKTTSADQERLTAVRGVADPLYNSDTGGADITNTDIEKAYQQAYPNYWSTSDELEYRGTVVHAATAAVHNIGGNSDRQPDGHAQLSHVNITNTLSAQNSHLSNGVFVVSAGEWKPGLDVDDIDVGGWILTFVDGILIGKKSTS